jgi:hypothetical protein
VFLKLRVRAEGVFEPAFDEIDGNPLPTEFLRRVNGCAATASLKIAQPFMAGKNAPTNQVPSGTAEHFFRPCRDLRRFRTANPAINGWAIFKANASSGNFVYEPTCQTRIKN